MSRSIFFLVNIAAYSADVFRILPKLWCHEMKMSQVPYIVGPFAKDLSSFGFVHIEITDHNTAEIEHTESLELEQVHVFFSLGGGVP